jgi:nitroreductase
VAACQVERQPDGRRDGVGAVDFADVVRRRRMVRDYDPDRPVPPEVRERLLEHALRAPSAGFSQGWAFLVLESAEERGRFWAATTGDGPPDGWLTRMRRAPLLVVPFSHKAAYLERYAEPDKGWADRDEARWPVPYWDVDTGMAALLMLLTAVDEGLGACFFGIPPDRVPDLRAAFGVPADHTPIGCVSVGYAGSEDRPSPSLRRGRRGAAEVVHRGRWGRRPGG